MPRCRGSRPGADQGGHGSRVRPHPRPRRRDIWDRFRGERHVLHLVRRHGL